MKCRSLFSAHIIHELLTGTVVGCSWHVALLCWFSSTVINNSTQSSEAEKIHGIPMLTPRLEMEGFPMFFFELFWEQFAIIDY